MYVERITTSAGWKNSSLPLEVAHAARAPVAVDQDLASPGRRVTTLKFFVRSASGSR